MKNILVALFAIALLIGSNESNGQESETPKIKTPPPISLESLFHPEKKFDYDGKLPTVRWINDSDLLIRDKQGWMQIDLATGNRAAWAVADQLRERIAKLPGIQPKQIDSALASALGGMDRTDATVLTRIGKALAVVSLGQPARWLTRDATHWKHAQIDPTGTMVAYTNEGDLYLVDIVTGRTFQMTQDGSDTLLDGVLDWIYQEEIYGRGRFRAFWFSPNGKWLAMLRIDTSAVEPYTITAASTDRGSSNVTRYSKAGDPIPHASLYVWDLRNLNENGVPRARLIDQSTAQQERIISGVWWHRYSGRLIYSISNREQTWRELRYVDESFLLDSSQTSKRLLQEQSPAWVEPPTAPGFLEDGQVVWQSELPNGYSRLYRIDADGTVVVPLTPESFGVKDFSIAADGKTCLFTSAPDGDPTQQKLYKIDITRVHANIPEPVSLTDGSGWHSTRISPDGSAFVDAYSSLRKPTAMSIRSAAGSFSAITLGENRFSAPNETLSAKLVRLKTTDGFSLPGILHRPLSASQQKPCGVIIETYGGPQAPVAQDRWLGTRLLYREFLARRGIAVLVVDNRSSAGRMSDTWAIRGRFGEVELSDLDQWIQWLKNQDWVDASRIGLRGWSYGGFMTLHAMTRTKHFAAGIAGGSVSDWTEYDSFYTERYMGLPTENADGYRLSSPVHVAKDLHGKVLMIHGEVDDNVHPSGTLRMASALQKAGVDFEMMIYPGAAHAVHDRWQAWHLVKLTDRFLLQNLLSN